MIGKKTKIPLSGLKILGIKESDLTNKQRQAKQHLQALCFSDIDPKEIKEDFYNPEVASVLAYLKEELIGWAGIHQVSVEFEGKKIKLGGFGVCVHPKMRRRGIATKLCQAGMEFLKKQRCDMAFLSIDVSKKGIDRLYKRVDFVRLPRKFSWKNIHGQVKEDWGGMIASVCSRGLFEHVLKGKDVFYVGEGYW